MKSTVRLLMVVALVSLAGCQHIHLVKRSSPARKTATAPAPAMPRPLSPSTRLIVGRVIAVDPPRGFAFVDVGTDAPPSALLEGTELGTRTTDLRDTAQLRASRYVRGRTLGTTVISGQPSPGDEVVWLAP